MKFGKSDQTKVMWMSRGDIFSKKFAASEVYSLPVSISWRNLVFKAEISFRHPELPNIRKLPTHP
jgi:hypothetical protein